MSANGLVLSQVLADCNLPVNQRTHRLTDSQARNIFDTYSYPPAVACVSGWIGSDHPQLVIAAMQDMAFNLGCAGIEVKR